ncbi:glycosyltransferase family 4 protein [Methanothrix sp.]|uniref:glycosyltransferase family 4 protein n=1 Tax=Methanothrix sp. TaxID=90426 RepID=UPI003BB7B149
MNKLKKLKMIYIGPAFSDGSGVGGGARLKNLIPIFNRMGIRIHLISVSYYSENLYIESKKINDLFYNTIIHLPASFPRYLKALSIIPVFFLAFRSCRSKDIIFADFTVEISYLPAIFLKYIFKKPLILDFIDAKFFKFIPDSLKSVSARQADMIFSISHYLESYAKSKYRCKHVVYVPNFVDTNLFKFESYYRTTLRNELNIEDDEIVIGYAGAFVYWEGISILLNAFYHLIKQFPRIRLAIMGKNYSPGDEDISNEIDQFPFKDRVILIPSQPYSNVPKYLSAFDILCCPKIDCEINRAANPVKVVEYISMGLPTVCSAVGGIVDTIDDLHDGFLVKPGDSIELRNTIEWILLNPEEAKRIALNGRKKAVSQFSYNAIEYKLGREICSLLDGF